MAEVTHNKNEADRIADELRKSECDLPGWSECLTEYLKYKAARGANPYREGRDVPNRNPELGSDSYRGRLGNG